MAIQKITAKIIADGAIIATDIADGSITTAKIADANVTAAKIVSVANTQVTGLITASQIAAVNGAVVTANTIANSAFQTGSVENYMSAQNLGIGMRNRIINGDMRIDQRNAGALVSGAAGEIYGVDRFITGVFGSGTGRISVQQSSTVPTGFVKSLINTVTTADAAPSANYGYCVTQRIEGFNTSDLEWGTANAKTITISFWVRNSITGTYTISVVNRDVTWGYTTTYTVSSANTWEYKTVTFTGPTSGTWDTTNLAGINLVFGLGGGSNRQATLNSWYAPTSTNTPTDATGCVDWIATAGATFYITGIQLEVGSTATPFERRQYGQELALCQRYYNKSFSIGTAPNNSSSGTDMMSTIAGCLAVADLRTPVMSFPVVMRATPTITFYQVRGATSGQWAYYVSGTGWIAVTTTQTNDICDSSFSVGLIKSATWTAQSVYNIAGAWVASAEL